MDSVLVKTGELVKTRDNEAVSLISVSLISVSLISVSLILVSLILVSLISLEPDTAQSQHLAARSLAVR
jgi:hypothetical protein